MERALEGRRAASASSDTAFVDADIAFHAAVVAAARNPVLADLFGEFTPVLREGLIELLALTALRDDDPNTADEAHAALVRAVAEGTRRGRRRFCGRSWRIRSRAERRGRALTRCRAAGAVRPAARSRSCARDAPHLPPRRHP